MKPGGDPLLDRRVFQQVAGELLDRELIERLIAVERRNDPIAVGPHLAIVVEMQTVRVGITGRIEPVAAAVFASAARPRKRSTSRS